MLELAIKIADRSTGKRHKTGAVIVDRNGDIISTGWSHRTELTHVSTPWSMHAEMHAIMRARGYEHRLDRATIYIATVITRSGNLTSGEPCKFCERLIQSSGITDVVFTQHKRVG